MQAEIIAEAPEDERAAAQMELAAEAAELTASCGGPPTKRRRAPCEEPSAAVAAVSHPMTGLGTGSVGVAAGSEGSESEDEEALRDAALESADPEDWARGAALPALAAVMAAHFQSIDSHKLGNGRWA